MEEVPEMLVQNPRPAVTTPEEYINAITAWFAQSPTGESESDSWVDVLRRRSSWSAAQKARYFLGNAPVILRGMIPHAGVIRNAIALLPIPVARTEQLIDFWCESHEIAKARVHA